MPAYLPQNMGLIKNNYRSIITYESVVPVNLLLDLVMMKRRKVLVADWIISDLEQTL